MSCYDDNTLLYRGQAEANGMTYEILARIVSDGPVTCSAATVGNATLTASGKRQTLVWTGETEYNIEAGTKAAGYSFKGPDPHAAALKSLTTATKAGLARLLSSHLRDFTALFDGFSLDIGQKVDNERSTDELVAAYQTGEGNPYLEWLTFSLGRFLCVYRPLYPQSIV